MSQGNIFEGWCDMGEVGGISGPSSWTGPQSRKKFEIQRAKEGALFTKHYWIYLAIEQDFPKCIISVQLPDVYCKTHIRYFLDTYSRWLIQVISKHFAPALRDQIIGKTG